MDAHTDHAIESASSERRRDAASRPGTGVANAHPICPAVFIEPHHIAVDGLEQNLGASGSLGIIAEPIN